MIRVAEDVRMTLRSAALAWPVTIECGVNARHVGLDPRSMTSALVTVQSEGHSPAGPAPFWHGSLALLEPCSAGAYSHAPRKLAAPDVVRDLMHRACWIAQPCGCGAVHFEVATFALHWFRALTDEERQRLGRHD